MTKLDAVDLQNKELNDLYDFEYNRRFPESEDSIPTQFVRGLSRELSDPNSYANKGGSFADGLGEGFVQGATDGYLREADKHKHEGMGDIYDIIADIKLQTQKLKADALNDQADINQKNQAIKRLTPPVRQLSEAQYAGDTNAVHDIGRGIFEMMKSMGMVTGNYITTRDGTIIGEDENGVESININDLIAQSGKTPEEIFGDDADRIMSMLSKGSKAKYEQVQAMSQAELDEKYAKADNLNAQAGKYDAEAGKIGYEMQNPPMSEIDKFNMQTVRTSNEDFLKTIRNSIAKNQPELKIKVLDRMEELLTDAGSEFGGTPFNALSRFYKKKLGLDSDIQEATMLQKYFFPDIKGVAGNPNQKEWDDLLKRIISGETNVNAALKALKFERQEAENQINNYNNYRKALIETNHSIPYYHPEIDKLIKSYPDERKEKNYDKIDNSSNKNQNPLPKSISEEDFILMVDPETGEKEKVYKDDVDKAETELGLKKV